MKGHDDTKADEVRGILRGKLTCPVLAVQSPLPLCSVPGSGVVETTGLPDAGLRRGFVAVDRASVRTVLTSPAFLPTVSLVEQGLIPGPGSLLGRHATLTGRPRTTHLAIRGVLGPHLTAPKVQTWQTRARTTFSALLGAKAVHGRPFDFKSHVAEPFAERLIERYLGIDVDFPALRRSLSVVTRPSAHTPATVERALDEVHTHAGAALAAAWRSGGSALTDGLRSAARDGVLTTGDAAGLFALLLTTASRTVAEQITSHMLLLLEEPHLYAQLRRGGLSVRQASQLLLRHTPLTAYGTAARTAVADVRIDGVDVPEGSTVIAATGHADCPALAGRGFAPSLYRHRDPGGNLVFGFGPHHCLGAAWARMAHEAALAELAAFRRLRLAVPVAELAFLDGGFFRGVTSLPVQAAHAEHEAIQ